MGPHSDWYLFPHWLPARALPLGARAAFATEMTEVTRKEVAAAVGGMNCSTSVSACSNTSRRRRRRSSGFKGLQMGRFYFPSRTGEKAKEEDSAWGGKMCLRERGTFLWHKQTCSLPTTLQLLLPARWTRHMFQREGRYKTKALPLEWILPSLLISLCQRNRIEDQVGRG